MVNYCSSLFSMPSAALLKNSVIDATSNKTVTGTELQTLVLKTAHWLKLICIGPEPVVAIHLPNGLEALVVHMAAQFIGATSCLLDPLLREKQLDYYLQATGSRLLISHLDKTLLEPVLPPEVTLTSIGEAQQAFQQSSALSVQDMYDWDKERTSHIYFTSGTTSMPKGVPLTYSNHENFFKITDRYWQPVDESSRHLCFVPFSHGFGSTFLIPLTFRTHAQLVILRSFHPSAVLAAIKQYGITHLYGVPSHYQQLLKMPDSRTTLTTLKMAFCAAAKLDKAVIADWERVTGIRLEEGYGLIETTGGIVWRVGIPARETGHMGIIPDSALIELGVLDETNQLVDRGALGEIAVRGKSVMKGYINNPEENARVFVDGWFKTGDAGYISTDNHLFMTGRVKDIINIAGIKISPFEVEMVVNEHPAVEQSIVVAFEDAVYGEVVKAYIKLRDTAITERELVRYAAQHLMSYQVPKNIEFVKEFPLNTMGKIDRKKLRNNGMARVQ